MEGVAFGVVSRMVLGVEIDVRMNISCLIQPRIRTPSSASPSRIPFYAFSTAYFDLRKATGLKVDADLQDHGRFAPRAELQTKGNRGRSEVLRETNVLIVWRGHGGKRD